MTDDQAPTASRRRKVATPRTDAKTRARIDRMVVALEGLAQTLAHQGPIIDKFQTHLEEEEKEGRERQSKERFAEQRFSIITATLARLDTSDQQERHRERVWRARMRAVLRTVAGGCGTIGVGLLFAYLTGTDGRLTMIPWPLVLSAILLLFGLGVVCLAASTDVSPLPAEQVNPVNTVQP